MIVVGLFLFGLISGFSGYASKRKRDDKADHTAKLMTAVMLEEAQKKRDAELGKPAKSSKATDFKQTR